MGLAFANCRFVDNRIFFKIICSFIRQNHRGKFRHKSNDLNYTAFINQFDNCYGCLIFVDSGLMARLYTQFEKPGLHGFIANGVLQ